MHKQVGFNCLLMVSFAFGGSWGDTNIGSGAITNLYKTTF